MIEYSQDEQGDIPGPLESGVKVIGVGGAGANVLDRMALEGSDDAELLTLNTDVRALSTSVSSDKIQLGSTLLKGMGTGGDPSLGKQAALEAVDEIREAVRGHSMVFLCVGLGGGTGSGAAPEVCRIVREEGVFLVVFATMPFTFEGARRTEQAEEALDTIGKYANAVITFDNDRMGELIVPKDGVAQAFAAADKIISQSIRASMNVVFRPGIIRIGMDDLLSALDSKKSRCLFGYGVAKGDNRAHEALEQALKCPLLDRGKLLSEAKAVLVQVAGGETMTLYEVQMVMEEISKHVGEKTQILFGTGNDKRLGNTLAVTIISSVNDGEPEEAEEDYSQPQMAPVSLSATPAASLAGVPEPPATIPAMEEPEAVEPEMEESIFEEPISSPPRVATEPEPLEIEDEPEAALEEDDLNVFEPLDSGIEPEEERPSYSVEPLADFDDEDDSTPLGEEDLNPIARAVGSPPELADDDNVEPIAPVDPGGVEAVTDSSQKIKLTRMVSSGNTGRIKAKPTEAEDSGPVLPPAKPPALPPEEEPEQSDEIRQQQEMLQLEPVAGKGRFAKTDPTIVDGEDLDVPTFLRKKK